MEDKTMSDECKKMTPDTQYQVIANEYVSALQGSQTVIVINLAISIGILAAMTTMLATGKYAEFLNLITLSVLSVVGLLGTICCIRTLHISRKQLISFQGRMMDFEKEYGVKTIHSKYYYKPLHITLFGFWVFTAIFMIVLSICLVELLIPNLFGFLSITITFTILVLCLFGIAKISDLCYKKIEKALIK